MNEATAEMQGQRDEEAIYEQFVDLMDLKEWKEARSLVAKTIDSGYRQLSLTMNKYFQEYVCEDCMGTGEVVEGEFDNQIIRKCLCQKE